MKLLGWMHRKFRQNSNEQFKDLVIGHSTFDDQHNYTKPNYGTKNMKTAAQRDHHVRNSFSGVEAAREYEDYEEESSIVMSELFHGFLAIGTLGSEQVISNPATPTFAISVENITEKESEVTEYDLKLINDELEKVLGADAKDEGRKDSSARNSDVSTGRSSHGSTITLSGKPLEGEDVSANGSTTCPLQGYLFGSAVELSETTKVAKKENRASLGELFQREDKGAEKEKETDKSAIQLMKKKLKKRMLHASSKSSLSATGEPGDSAEAETKLHKIIHMFHRKVHPESSATGKPVKSQQSENKKRTDYTGSDSCDLVLPIPEENKHMQAVQAFGRERNRRSKCTSNLPQFALRNSKSFQNKEHWIKSDADYLVLEL